MVRGRSERGAARRHRVRQQNWNGQSTPEEAGAPGTAANEADCSIATVCWDQYHVRRFVGRRKAEERRLTVSRRGL